MKSNPGVQYRPLPCSIKLLLLGLFSCLFLPPLVAQPSNPSFKHFSVEDGISDIRVHAIMQDRQGFIWFGTSDGLNRYDGYSFKTYYHEASDSTSIPTNYVQVLFEIVKGISGLVFSMGR